MKNSSEGGRYRRLIASALFGLMVLIVVLGGALEWRGRSAAGGWQVTLMALFAGLAICAAYSFPIHIRYHTKVAMTSVPLFVAVALLPVPVAMLVAGGGTLIGELVVRKERGNLPIDVAVSTLRWSALSLVAGLVANAPAPGPLGQTMRLLGAAVALFLGDALTAAMHVALVSRESPWVVLRAVLRQAGAVELVQYLLGLLGAFSALDHFWSPVLLLLPTAIIYVAFKNSMELQDSTRQILEGMADAVDLRDANTGGHSRRVGALCADVLRQLGISGPEADLIVSAARVHDIGKIGTPDDILRKPGTLEPWEYKVMQAHAAQGAEMLNRYRDFARGADFVRHHHERWDGRGYPAGLAGTSIPFGSRVIAVADSYDAMTSARPYRGPMSPDEAVVVLQAGRGTQWDASVVDGLLMVIGDRLQHAVAVERAALVLTRQFPAGTPNNELTPGS